MTARQIAELFARIELMLIASLRRNLSAHKAWEKGEGFSWPAWQAEVAKNLDTFRRENRAIMAEYQPVIDEETEKLLREQFDEGIDAEAERIREIAPDRGKAVPDSQFFGMNTGRLENLIKDMQDTERRAESAALRLMDDVYRRVPAQAELAMASGAVTLPQAVDMATKSFLEAGVNCITYQDGRRVNIASYAEMALRTAATRAQLQGEAQKRMELGIDTVLVSQYGACSETCLPWQGRIYIDDVWAVFRGERSGDYGKSRDGKSYLLLSVAIRNGLFHPNCRHTLTTWIDGISRKPPPLEAEKVRRAAALERQQRALEREVRKYKRLREGTEEAEKRREYDRKVKDAQKRLNAFVKEHKDILRRDPWRERVTHNADIAAMAPRNTGTPTHYNATATYRAEIDGYGEHILSAMAKANRKVAELGDIAKNEQLVLLDLESGEEVYYESGEDESVGGSGFWAFVEQNSQRKLAFIHNHGTDGMLSETDLRTFFDNDNIQIMEAVRNDGVLYAIKKDGTKKPATMLFDDLYQDEINELSKKYREGIITAGERTRMREETIVFGLIKDYTGGLMEFDTRR